MGLKANNNTGKEFKRPDPLEAGGYPGRIVRVYDLGLQPQNPYQGQEKSPAHEIMVTYELSDEFMKDDEGNDLEDKPRWVSESFPLLSLKADRAKSTLRMKAIDPQGSLDGDWSETLSMPVTINLIQNKGKDGRIFENVQSLSTIRVKDAARLPELKNPAKFFDLQDPDIEVFNSLPQWIRDKITSNLEFAGSPLEKLLKEDKGEPKEDPKKPAKKAVKAKEEPSEKAEESEDAPW